MDDYIAEKIDAMVYPGGRAHPGEPADPEEPADPGEPVNSETLERSYSSVREKRNRVPSPPESISASDDVNAAKKPKTHMDKQNHQIFRNQAKTDRSRISGPNTSRVGRPHRISDGNFRRNNSILLTSSQTACPQFYVQKEVNKQQNLATPRQNVCEPELMDVSEPELIQPLADTEATVGQEVCETQPTQLIQKIPDPSLILSSGASPFSPPMQLPAETQLTQPMEPAFESQPTQQIQMTTDTSQSTHWALSVPQRIYTAADKITNVRQVVSEPHLKLPPANTTSTNATVNCSPVRGGMTFYSTKSIKCDFEIELKGGLQFKYFHPGPPGMDTIGESIDYVNMWIRVETDGTFQAPMPAIWRSLTYYTTPPCTLECNLLHLLPRFSRSRTLCVIKPNLPHLLITILDMLKFPRAEQQDCATWFGTKLAECRENYVQVQMLNHREVKKIIEVTLDPLPATQRRVLFMIRVVREPQQEMCWGNAKDEVKRLLKDKRGIIDLEKGITLFEWSGLIYWDGTGFQD
ncbi:hypothetical protein EDC01DRAFT_635291 [Geopyxis carbonaria]|nr:hypothetical protein EDC01DRAFT_635291 [Geopyxis carbonaria]